MSLAVGESKPIIGAGDCGTIVVEVLESGTACNAGHLVRVAESEADADVDVEFEEAFVVSAHHLFSTYMAFTNDRRRDASDASGNGKSCLDHLASSFSDATELPPLLSCFTSSGVKEDIPMDLMR